jgi:lipopolysaccharide/colanic/teichoic acid biosynthesis glycosyltransferase
VIAARAAAVAPDSAARRAVDVVVSLLALVVLAPVLIGIAAAIVVTDPGRALYRQVRVGRDGREFHLVKFRSMVRDADRVGPMVSAAHDPRITTVGRWLRRTKLDELPQLINVLRGDMTLIGPRPEVPRYLAHYRDTERLVLAVRPGLTGPGQVRYSRSQATELDAAADPEQCYLLTQLHPKLATELDYLVRRSLRGDLGILVATGLTLLRG